MAGIFICYRREDTAPYAGRLIDRLAREFSDDQVFMDIDNIEPGDDFAEVIDERLATCNVVIALMGREWLRCKDKAGQRRVDKPDDFVRMELTRALARKIRVIPVLVAAADMPASNELPDDLKPLSSRHAIELSDARFHSDVGPLIERIHKDLAAAATAVPAEVPTVDPAPAPAPSREAGRWPGAVMTLRRRVRERVARMSFTDRVFFAGAALLLVVGNFFGGRPDVAVPNLDRASIDQAREALATVGLIPGQVETVESDTVAEGSVVGQQPTRGATVRRGSAVDLVVAESPKVEVPNIVGMPIQQARALLASRGLKMPEPGMKSGADARVTVTSQEPKAGERVKKGTEVGGGARIVTGSGDATGRHGPYATMQRAQEIASQFVVQGYRAAALQDGDGYYVDVQP